MAQKPSVTIGMQVEMQFISDNFGLKFIGLPDTTTENQYIVKGGEITVQNVTDPNGKILIKLCADPAIFDKNYPNQITGTMTGIEIIEMALKISKIDGVLICSATSFHSYPIYRNKLIELYNKIQNNKTPNKPWWKIW